MAIKMVGMRTIKEYKGGWNQDSCEVCCNEEFGLLYNIKSWE